MIDAWQRWAPDAPDTVTAHLSLVAPDFADEEPYVDLFGVGDEPSAVRPLLHAVSSPSIASAVHPMDATRTARYLSGLIDREHTEVELPQGPPPRSGWMLGRSGFVDGLLSAASLADLVKRFAVDRVPGALRDMELTPFGGAYAATRPDATAFAHRSARFLLAYRVFLGANATRSARSAERRWLDDSWRSVCLSGPPAVYSGYADPHLADYAAAYYGPNLARLSAVKRAYDPADLFSYGQPVPLPD